MSLIKLATNALMKRILTLPVRDIESAGKAGMIRSKNIYLQGLIKGNENIKNQLENRIGKINFKHGSFASDPKIKTIFTNPSSTLDSLIVKKKYNGSNKDLRIFDALNNRHELHEMHYGTSIPKNNLGIFYSKSKKEIVANHATGAVLAHEIVDAKKIPSVGSLSLLSYRNHTGELPTILNVANKNLSTLRHSDASKVLKFETRYRANNPNSYYITR